MSIWQATLKGAKTDLPHPDVDLAGTTVIVTGSNAGLGKEVAIKLAAMKPAKLVCSPVDSTYIKVPTHRPL